MSRSPFLPPSRRRSREAARRRRRRQRRRVLVAIVFAAIVAALAYVVLAHGATTSHAHKGAASARARRATRGGAPGAGPAARLHVEVDEPRLSPAGFLLGRPPLALNLADPAADPLHLGFPELPHAGIVVDLDSGRVLWQHDPLARLRVASLTKMMTALLTVKSASPHARVLITKQAEETSGSKVGVLPLGRRVPLEPLLYGLLLPSGNDAAVALAQHVAGTVHSFVGEMNEEAARLGLGCTHYSSPSGYYNTHNYSCAADLAELAGVDLRQPRIARVTRTRSAVLPFPIKGGKLYLYNNNPLLIYGYPGTTGMKTGETIEAGRCLVATAERHGVRLAVVLLHSPDPGTQARDLLNDAFQNVYHLRPIDEPPMPPGA
jgi:serine-type D-Ala-D-Ala carboxypeptidase (penicillin-binding protein 5/6)